MAEPVSLERRAVLSRATERWRRMVEIRVAEDIIKDLFAEGLVAGTTHTCQGQEAVAVGIATVLRPTDVVCCTYRGHGHSIALGVDPQKLMDEMLGRETGACGGRAGSMNVVDVESGLIGCFGIVGGSIGAATGAALAEKLRRTGNVAVAFFGDGTSNQAYFHESLNWAQIEKLPVIFVCENNLYMEFTPLFYGPEQTRDFIMTLASHYEDCLVFFEEGEQQMKVRDLPGSIDQYDVLFLP